MTVQAGTPVSQSRIHVLTPQEWGNSSGTDFWAFFSVNGILSVGNAHELADYGWTTTALSLLAGSAADMIDSADVGVPGGLEFGAASDLLQSPAIFGDYAHGRMVEAILGYTPTQLVLESYGYFTDATPANETASGFGLVDAGGSPITAANANAMIVANTTNFVLRSGGDSDAGAAVDAVPHLWKVVIDAGGVVTDKVEWFIDDVSQGTIDRNADAFPVSFGAGVQVAGTNFFVLSWLHIYYN